MDEHETIKILAELVKTGGQFAIWGLLGFQLLAVVKSSLSWIFGIFIVQSIVGAVKEIFKFTIERDLRDIKKMAQN